MKKFAWRLQRVLDIKRKEEQTKRAHLLAITEKLAQNRGGLQMQKILLKNLINDISQQDPKTRLSKQEFFLRCSDTNNKVIKKLENMISSLEKQQKEGIAEVIKIRRFKEGMEKMRDDAKSEFIKEQEKHEQKESDEIATVGFARKLIKQRNRQ